MDPVSKIFQISTKDIEEKLHENFKLGLIHQTVLKLFYSGQFYPRGRKIWELQTDHTKRKENKKIPGFHVE